MPCKDYKPVSLYGWRIFLFASWLQCFSEKTGVVIEFILCGMNRFPCARLKLSSFLFILQTLSSRHCLFSNNIIIVSWHANEMINGHSRHELTGKVITNNGLNKRSNFMHFGYWNVSNASFVSISYNACRYDLESWMLSLLSWMLYRMNKSWKIVSLLVNFVYGFSYLLLLP